MDWLGTSERSASDLLDSGTEVRSARDEAVELLRAELNKGPKPVPKLRAAAHAAGVSWRTMERAKKQLGVTTTKQGFDEGVWVWKLPTEDRQGQWRTSKNQEVAVFDITQRLGQESGATESEDRQAESLAAFEAKTAVLDVLDDPEDEVDP